MTAPVSLSAHRARRQKPYPAVFELPPCDMPVVRPHEPESGAARFVSLGLLVIFFTVLGVWAWRSLKGTP